MSVRPIRRRELLGMLSSLTLQPSEDVVPFIDYTLEFSTETQTENPAIKCFDLSILT